MNKILSFIIGAICIIATNHSNACSVDVTIDQGDSISLCVNEPNGLSASTGFVSYNWTGTVYGNGNLATPAATGWVYLEAEDNVGCISIDSIFVTIYPSTNPTISSSEGLNICPNVGGTILSLNQTYNAYLWSNSATTSTITATAAGNYTVQVTDGNGCLDTASIIIDVINFDVASLSGTTVCTGSTATLQASGGDVYAWSTGEFSPTIVVAPTETTTYSVTMYKGACQQIDSITLNIAQLPPVEIPDTVYVMPGKVGYVYGPVDFDSYSWSPASSLTASSGSGVGYTASESGDVILIATNDSLGCSVTKYIHFKIIDLTIPEGFSPNSDGINDFFEIPEIFSYKAALKIWNRWGDIVFESDDYQNNWDGTCQSSFCIGNDELMEGTYFYRLTIDGHNFDGHITLKK